MQCTFYIHTVYYVRIYEKLTKKTFTCKHVVWRLVNKNRDLVGFFEDLKNELMICLENNLKKTKKITIFKCLQGKEAC